MPNPILTILILLLSTSPGQADWPHLRGPHLSGGVQGSGTFQSEVGLEPAWTRTLGPAYSAISVIDGKAVTLFSDGDHDVAIAFDANDGKELWRTPFADTYRGHDGSTDGPIGTPTLDEERVYFVGPFGDLVALDLQDGRLLWSKSLKDDFGSSSPTYGHSATPLVFEDLLVVQAGGKDGRSVVALDRKTGRVQWTSADDSITYQNPVTTRIDEEPVLISVGGLKITALRLRTGEVLWSHAHSDKPIYDPTFPQPVLLQGNRILLTLDSEAVLFEYAAHGLKEIWRSSGFKRTVSTPVSHGEYLYGFSGRFLTCVNAATGRIEWKSRQPGGRGLIVVDGHLVILGSGGRLTVVEATPEGYREESSLQALEQSGYTAPSFADGIIFMRNLTHLAAVRVIGAPSVTEKPTHPVAGKAATGKAATGKAANGDFSAWVRRVEEAPSAKAKQHLVDSFMAASKSFPIIEGNTAHFIYHGPAEGVSLTGQMLADQEIPEQLTRIPETDVFYRSYELEPGGLWHYRFLVDFEDPASDHLNPRRALGEGEEISELVMPDFKDPEYFLPRDAPGPAGALETLEIHSQAYDENLDVQVYLPASYDGETPFPLVILPNGEQWLEAELPRALDQLFGSTASPTIASAVVVFVPIKGWVGGQWGGRAVRLIGRELLPELDKTYRLDTADGSASLWTVQEKAAIVMDLMRENPRFGRAALQSPRTYRGRLEPFEGSEQRGLRFFVSWSRYESRSAERGSDEVRAAQDLAAWLTSQGATVESGEIIPGPGFRTWRRQAAEILSFLLHPTGL